MNQNLYQCIVYAICAIAFVILAFCNIKADTFAFPGIMFVMLMFLSLFGTHGKQLILFKQKEPKDV